MGFPLFTLLSVVLVASALLVILQDNTLYSALALVVALFVTAIFFLVLDAELIAALQILVYAGAIMVLFLFVIMFLNLGERSGEKRSGAWLTAAVAGATLFILQLFLFFEKGQSSRRENLDVPSSFGSVREVARSLFTDFLLPFEITSLLLLVALIGAVVLAGRESRT